MATPLRIETAIDFAKIIQTDSLVPFQYLAVRRRSFQPQPELRLMAAVLEDAVATLKINLRRCSSRQRRDFAEAWQWINGRTDPRSVFSFINICETLAIDPDYLRQGLIRKSTGHPNHQPPAGARVGKYRAPRRKTIRLRAV